MLSEWLTLISAEVWEKAFLQHGKRTDSLDCEAIVRSAFGLAKVDLAERDDEDDEEIVAEILGAFEIATVGIEFPDSTHGDGMAVTISRFPNGTAVGRTANTWGSEKTAFVIANATAADVDSAATDAIYDSQDGADWNMDDDDDDDDDDDEGDEDDESTSSNGIRARLVGFTELRTIWNRPSKG